MKISIGADHRGYALKNYLIEHESSYQWHDVGAFSSERSDYPLFAQDVCSDFLKGRAERGVLICGSGVGMSIAANRHPGIYAAVCWDERSARIAREDDGVNVLVLPADFIDFQQATSVFRSWISATFKGGRYQERLMLIDL